jgi:GT2 family glycosyltransferase
MGNAALLARDQKDDGRWNCVADLDYICGASLLVKKEVIENIGLLDDSYFLYWEDVDWGMRARIKRYALVYCAGSKVWHKEEATSEGTSCIADYYWTRNGLFFMKKFYRWLLPLTLLSYLMKHTVLRLIRKQPTNFSAFIKGLQDFLKRRTGKWEDNPESGEE